MTLEELGSMLKDLEETRELAEAELAGVTARRNRIEGLERDRDDLLGYMSEAVPKGLESLTGEEHNKLYRMLRFEVAPSSEVYEVKGVFCTTNLPSTRTRKVTTVALDCLYPHQKRVSKDSLPLRRTPAKQPLGAGRSSRIFRG
jgi:hypothetical protein